MFDPDPESANRAQPLRHGVPVIATLAMGLVLGCAPSEGEIRSRFEKYVETANRCTVASECAIAAADCPLGCWVAVRVDRKGDVEAKARELIREYERGGRSCEYDCASPGPLLCAAGRCAAPPMTSPTEPDAGSAGDGP
jgi:hypothetical protein